MVEVEDPSATVAVRSLRLMLEGITGFSESVYMKHTRYALMDDHMILKRSDFLVHHILHVCWSPFLLRLHFLLHLQSVVNQNRWYHHPFNPSEKSHRLVSRAVAFLSLGKS